MADPNVGAQTPEYANNQTVPSTPFAARAIALQSMEVRHG